MAITDKEEGVWELDEVYNKINQGGIWSYVATDPQQLWMWGFQEQGTFSPNTPYPAALPSNKSQDHSSPVRIGTSTDWGVPATYASGPLGTAEPGFAYFGEQTAMLMMKQDSTLWGVGENKYGTQMRAPQNSARSSPIQLPGSWARISGTKQCVHGIKTNNTLWGWGSVQYGQLGNNETTGEAPSGYSSPIQIPGSWNRNYRVQSYGGMASKPDGTLWMWGQNENGQLGQNEAGTPGNPTSERATSRSSPAQVPGSWSDAGEVGSNGEVVMTKTDGTLWVWGRINALNIGPYVRRSSPCQVGTDTDWGTYAGAASAGGYQHAGCIKQDGTLWMWGINDYGTLGQNSRTHRSSPTQIPGTTWNSISCGLYGTAATKTDNTLWTWGYNQKGALGLNEGGPSEYRSSPTQVPGSWLGQQNFDRQTQAALKAPT
tara:strand:+ start:2201 stop:3490 length:1290 start_codon:yes stop_codon:yes gene_type:complete